MKIETDVSTLIGYVWFTAHTTIGIVLCVNTLGERKAYISSATKGYTEEEDLKSIMEWGAFFPVEEAESLIEKYGNWLIE